MKSGAEKDGGWGVERKRMVDDEWNGKGRWMMRKKALKKFYFYFYECNLQCVEGKSNRRTISQ